MKLKIIFSFFFVILVVLVAGCSKGLGRYDSFTRCLTEKGAKIYGTDWCPHCKDQKKRFGNSFQYVDYIDCDWNKEECREAGVKGYPTWIINGEKYVGEQELDRLASLTGCELVEDELK